MKEFCEFRVDEEYAGLLFGPTEGTRLGESVRKIVLSTSDDRYPRVGQLQCELLAKDRRPFFYGWDYKRAYSEGELEAAELLLLVVTACFEPTGEECGTGYDDALRCKYCGAGRRQTTPLILRTSRIPKGKDISRTLADEVVVSDRLALALESAGISGATLEPVQPMAHARTSSKWHQLTPTSCSVTIVSPTRIGNGPFDGDAEGLYRCPLGHSAGLNLLSEVSVRRADLDGADLLGTRQFVGWPGGVFTAHPLLLMSAKFLAVLRALNVRGYTTEVVHCR